jgi:hypothetical protein
MRLRETHPGCRFDLTALTIAGTAGKLPGFD